MVDRRNYVEKELLGENKVFNLVSKETISPDDRILLLGNNISPKCPNLSIKLKCIIKHNQAHIKMAFDKNYQKKGDF